MLMSSDKQREANMVNVSTLTTGAIDSNMERVKLRNLSEVGRVARVKQWRYEQEQLEQCELKLTLSGPPWAFDLLEYVLSAPGPRLLLRHHVLQAVGHVLGISMIPFRVIGGCLTRKRDNGA